MATPHDKLVKTVFSQVERARAELSAVLPAALVARIDWSTLELVSGEFVDPALAHHHTDLLYTVQLGAKRACIYVLLEHMSTVERMMPFRLLRYMTQIWARFEQDSPGEPLPRIIPVVLHHSDSGWTAPVRFADLFDRDEELGDALAPFVPDFSFVLDDLSKLDHQALAARRGTGLSGLTLVLLRSCRSADDLLAVLRPWRDTFVAVLTGPHGLEAMSAVLCYILEVSEVSPEDLRAFFRELGPEVEDTYMTTADMLRAEGEARGRAEVQTDALLKLLTVRFGPVPEQARIRVQTATAEQLDRWMDGVLGAASLDQLLLS